MKTKPYEFQIEGVKLINNFNGRVLLSDEMGLGKSLTSLLWINELPKERFPVLVVCPASLKYNWQNEARHHLGLRSEILEGQKCVMSLWQGNVPITIINYEILKYWLKYVHKLKPQTIILDEGHYLANPSAQRTRAVRKLCKEIPYTLILTGTPLTNRPIELWSLVNILQPELFPSRQTFGFRYCGARKAPWGWTFLGATRLAELHKILTENVMVRRRKEDVLSQLPKKRRIVIPLSLSKDDRSEYHKASTDFLSWISENKPERLSSATRAEGLLKFGYLVRLIGRMKLPSVMEWIENFLYESDEKIIVFTLHKKVMHALREKFPDVSTQVDGSITGKKRQLSFEKFLSVKKCRVLFGNLRAAGVGWSGKGVSNVMFCEFCTVPGLHTQGEDRCVGIGRGQEGISTSIWWLTVKDSIEERLVKVIQSKQKTLSKTLDGRGCADDLDVYDQLVQELRKEM